LDYGGGRELGLRKEVALHYFEGTGEGSFLRRMETSRGRASTKGKRENGRRLVLVEKVQTESGNRRYKKFYGEVNGGSAREVEGLDPGRPCMC